MPTKDYLQLLLSNYCLDSTLDNLKDNKETLFSCLLANRLFCQHVIPYLWSSPFNLETNPNRHKLILRTYISCLLEEEKRPLINFQIEFEELPTPTINYPEYLKIFNNQQIQDAVEKYIPTITDEESERNMKRRLLLSRIIAKLLVKRTKGFTNVEVIRDSLNYTDINIPSFPRLSQALSKLHTFEFAGDYPIILYSQEICRLFTNFAQHTSTIQKLSILFQSQDEQIVIEIAFEITQAITKLIRSQKKLTSFTITQYWDTSTCSEIYSAINSQSNSLKFLRIEELTDIQQLLFVLKNCKNLETLQLWRMGEIDSDSLFSLKYPGFRIESIKNLYCDEYYPNHSALTTVGLLLRICSPNLRMLGLGHVTKEILKDIGDYCPDLIYLSLKISKEELPYLIRLLSHSFTLLEHFTLSMTPDSHHVNSFNVNNTVLEFTTSSIIQLAKSIPMTLRYFGIDFIMKSRDFDYFFENFRVPLTQLAILENSMVYDNVLEAILKYAKRFGSLKELIYDQSYDEDENFGEKMIEEARTVIPKIRVLKRGKLSICKQYFDIQYYDESRRN